VQIICANLRPFVILYNMLNFYSEVLLALCSTPKLEDYSMLAVNNTYIHNYYSLSGRCLLQMQPENAPCCREFVFSLLVYLTMLSQLHS
jgi:hypothetical protein